MTVTSTTGATSQASAENESNPALPHRVGPLGAARHARTLFWRSMLKIRRNPEQLGELCVQPIMFLVLFVYVFGGAVARSTHAYLQFALPGLMVQTAMFASMGLGLALNTDITKGIFDRFRSLPVARSAPLVGAVGGELVRYVLSMLVLLGMGIVMGFRIATNPLAALVGFGLIIAFVTSMAWVSVLIGVLARSAQSVQIWGFALMFPLTFGSNVFVPTATMPGWLQAWVRVNPVSQLSDAARGLLVGGPVLHPAATALVWAAGITALFAPLAVRAYRRKG
ncbi:MAG TPA: ABC transporter permease [Mycobacteriales bacterium]|jgi:ABC-type polysaccharide/polyol phosphate export systems, permease component